MYTPATRLADVIFDDFSMIPLLNRFGIRLGLGDSSIESICTKHNIDTDFFLTILNTYASRSDTSLNQSLMNMDTEQTIRYLESTNTYYASAALPNIERHFRALHERSMASANNLEFLWKFFQELKSELTSRIEFDNSVWFPALRKLLQNPADGSLRKDMTKELAGLPADENAIEDKVDDLTSFFIIHLRGEYDQNLCLAVVTSLMALEKDIKRNNRIRNLILRPVTRAALSAES